MKKLKYVLLTAVLAVSVLTGCSYGEKKKDDSAVTNEEESKDTSTENSDKVASSGEMAEKEEVVEEGMEPVVASLIKDGTYDVTVDTSSSMFTVTSCNLTVKDGQMSAVMTMKATGYLKVFMGTAKEAAASSEEECIPFVENENGEHTFTVPVEALDKGIDCAAFSKKKEKWYDRTILFRADSLPVDAFKEGVTKSAKSLGLEDGTYTVDISLAGGSGKSDIKSPATITVKDGAVVAEIVWSSSNYDYMKVNGQKYDMLNTEGNSTFEIPIEVFDWKIPVIANTVAMSEPHEIEYTIFLDSGTIKKAE